MFFKRSVECLSDRWAWTEAGDCEKYPSCCRFILVLCNDKCVYWCWTISFFVHRQKVDNHLFSKVTHYSQSPGWHWNVGLKASPGITERSVLFRKPWTSFEVSLVRRMQALIQFLAWMRQQVPVAFEDPVFQSKLQSIECFLGLWVSRYGWPSSTLGWTTAACHPFFLPLAIMIQLFIFFFFKKCHGNSVLVFSTMHIFASFFTEVYWCNCFRDSSFVLRRSLELGWI